MSKICEGCEQTPITEQVFYIVQDSDGTEHIKSAWYCHNCIMLNTSEEEPLYDSYANAMKNIQSHF